MKINLVLYFKLQYKPTLDEFNEDVSSIIQFWVHFFLIFSVDNHNIEKTVIFKNSLHVKENIFNFCVRFHLKILNLILALWGYGSFCG